MGELPFTDASYERFLNEDKLMGSKCKQCGALFVPPRPICIKCYGRDMEWVKMKGTGTLQAFTCIAVAPPRMCEQGYDRNNPYCSGVVEIDEGVKVVARIEGVDTKHPDTIKIGVPMVVKFLHLREGENPVTVLAFQAS